MQFGAERAAGNGQFPAGLVVGAGISVPEDAVPVPQIAVVGVEVDAVALGAGVLDVPCLRQDVLPSRQVPRDDARYVVWAGADEAMTSSLSHPAGLRQ